MADNSKTRGLEMILVNKIYYLCIYHLSRITVGLHGARAYRATEIIIRHTLYVHCHQRYIILMS